MTEGDLDWDAFIVEMEALSAARRWRDPAEWSAEELAEVDKQLAALNFDLAAEPAPPEPVAPAPVAPAPARPTIPQIEAQLAAANQRDREASQAIVVANRAKEVTALAVWALEKQLRDMQEADARAALNFAAIKID